MANILIVDDDVNIGELNKDRVSAAGHTAKLVHHPCEALDELERQDNYQVILSDYDMPGMDGIQLAAKIRKLYKIPVALITGNALRFSEEDKKAAKEAGIDIILGKPISYDKFILAIDTLLTPSE